MNGLGNHTGDSARYRGYAFFGGGSTGTSQNTTTTNSSPWAGQQGYLTGNTTSSWAPDGSGTTATAPGSAGTFASAQALYEDQNAWPQYYPASTYSPLTGTQQQFINGVEGTGAQGGNTALQGANSNLSSVLDPNYTSQTQQAFDAGNGQLGAMGGNTMMSWTQPAFINSQGSLQNTISGNGTGAAGASSSYDSSNPQIGYLGAGSQLNTTQPTFNNSQNYLNNTLSGSGLNITQQPGWQSAVNTALASAIPQSQASFIAGGRTDSGLAQAADTSAATNAVGNLANQAYLGQEQLQQGAASQAAQNQSMGLSATQNADSLASQNLMAQLGIQQNAIGQAATDQNNTTNSTLAAEGLASNNLLTQQGNQIKGDLTAPGVDGQQMSDLSTGLTAAGVDQTNNQNQLNANVANYNYNQQLPWQMLGDFNQIVGGNGYGGTVQSTTPMYSSTAGNILGGVTGGLSVGNTLAGALGYASLGSLLGGL